MSNRDTPSLTNPETASTESGTSGRIRDWTPSRRKSTHAQIQRAGNYSRFVDVMKFFLPASACGLLVLLIVFSWLNGGNTRIPLPVTEIDDLEKDLVMTTPLMTGFDGKNRPYIIEADQAVQNAKQPQLIDLINVRGNLAVDRKGEDQAGADDMQVTAREGYLNSDQDELELVGDVILRSENSYTFWTERAHVNFGQATVTGNQPITGESTMGNVEADGFDVWDNGNRIRFRGNVKTIINSEKKRDDVPAAGPEQETN